MTVHTNKILVQRYYEEMWNTWNFALTDELLSGKSHFVDHSGWKRWVAWPSASTCGKCGTRFQTFTTRSSNWSRKEIRLLCVCSIRVPSRKDIRRVAFRQVDQLRRRGVFPRCREPRCGGMGPWRYRQLPSAARSANAPEPHLGQYNADFCRRRDGCSWRSGGSSIDF
jgi:hypothetical protein